MGVNIKDILIKHPITLEELSGKTLAVDAFNMLYQFLTTIRAPDGSYLTDSKGRITSHLIGLFNRTTALLQKGIRLVFVFDGEPPALKHQEIARRAGIKQEAEKSYEKAAAAEDVESMKKFAARMTKLSDDMVGDAKKLLQLLGIPVVQAPSEGEAQCAFLVKQGDAWAVASQDYDALLSGTPRLVQNLSIVGRRKKIHGMGTIAVSPELADLKENLEALGINQEQLILLAMLVGTDYNPGGIKGIGPKTALQLVKEHKSKEQLFSAAAWEEHVAVSWKEVLATLEHIPVTKHYHVKQGILDTKGIMQFLVEEHNFSPERVQKALEGIATQPQRQKGLGEFL